MAVESIERVEGVAERLARCMKITDGSCRVLTGQGLGLRKPGQSSASRQCVA